MKRKKSPSVLHCISSFFTGLHSNSADSQSPKTTSKISDFQIEIASLFSQFYPNLGEQIQTEWQAVKDVKGIYGPRVSNVNPCH